MTSELHAQTRSEARARFLAALIAPEHPSTPEWEDEARLLLHDVEAFAMEPMREVEERNRSLRRNEAIMRAAMKKWRKRAKRYRRDLKTMLRWR